MAVRLLDSVAAFLHALADVPRPGAAADVIVDSFHDSLDMRAAAVLVARPPHMIVFALSGLPSEQVGDFDVLSLDDDYPATRAYHEAEVVIDAVLQLPQIYAAMSSPGSRGRAMIERFPKGDHVSVPIVGGGRTLGAYTAACEVERDWSPLDLAALSTIGHALGMWLTHPDSGLPDESALRPGLSARQADILERVATGMGNAAIAADLGFSESTVKAEIGRAMRSLGVDSRAAAAELALATGLIPRTIP